MIFLISLKEELFIFRHTTSKKIISLQFTSAIFTVPHYMARFSDILVSINNLFALACSLETVGKVLLFNTYRGSFLFQMQKRILFPINIFSKKGNF